jgi:hypothetical protein
MATQYAFGKIVTNGLVLALDAADKNSYVSGSTTWNDVSGNGLNAIPTGSGFPAYNAGNSGNLVFNTNPLNVGNRSILNLTNLTLSVWYKTTATGNQQLIAKNYTTSYYLNIAPAANSFSLWTNGGDLNSPVITTLGNGNWHSISATMSGTTKTLYYDGSQVSTGAGTIPAVDSFNLVIGSTGGNNPNPFVGSMGNILIYNRALSATEIAQNYNAQKSRFGLS